MVEVSRVRRRPSSEWAPQGHLGTPTHWKDALGRRDKQLKKVPQNGAGTVAMVH